MFFVMTPAVRRASGIPGIVRTLYWNQNGIVGRIAVGGSVARSLWHIGHRLPVVSTVGRIASRGQRGEERDTAESDKPFCSVMWVLHQRGICRLGLPMQTADPLPSPLILLSCRITDLLNHSPPQIDHWQKMHQPTVIRRIKLRIPLSDNCEPV